MITGAVELSAVAPRSRIILPNSSWIVFLKFMRTSFPRSGNSCKSEVQRGETSASYSRSRVDVNCYSADSGWKCKKDDRCDHRRIEYNLWVAPAANTQAKACTLYTCRQPR